MTRLNSGGMWVLQVCVFLNEDRSCGVYHVRPLQCSTYPWWPELMPQRNWAAERGEWPAGRQFAACLLICLLEVAYLAPGQLQYICVQCCAEAAAIKPCHNCR